MRFQLPGLEVAFHQAACLLGDDQTSSRRHILQVGGQVRRLAKCQALRLSTFSHGVSDHLAGGNPDPHLDPQVVARRHLEMETSDGFQDSESGAHGALRVVLVRLGKAEIHHQAVAKALSDVALEPLHHHLAHTEGLSDDRPVILRVEPGCQLGGTDQIAEQHGELAAFPRRSGKVRRRTRRPDDRPRRRGLTGRRRRSRHPDAAVGAELRRGHDLGAAAGASRAEQQSARHAEARALVVLGIAAQTVHMPASVRQSAWGSI